MVPVNNSPVTIARRGLMLVISSPSGAGKSTIARNLLDKDKNIGLSVSVTTRPRRQSEIDGIHYHFISKRDFERLRTAMRCWNGRKFTAISTARRAGRWKMPWPPVAICCSISTGRAPSSCRTR